MFLLKCLKKNCGNLGLILLLQEAKPTTTRSAVSPLTQRISVVIFVVVVVAVERCTWDLSQCVALSKLLSVFKDNPSADF